MSGIPDNDPVGGAYVPWRIYERDRARDERDRQERRRELDNTFREVRNDSKETRLEIEALTKIVTELKDAQEAEINQRTGKAAVGRAIWVYIAGGLLLLVSIASGVVSIIVGLRG